MSQADLIIASLKIVSSAARRDAKVMPRIKQLLMKECPSLNFERALLILMKPKNGQFNVF